MSLTLNMVGGGSGGGSISSAYAIIAVDYPVGGVCTCTDGVEILRATGGTGFFVFPIPYAATWTVSVTNGVDTSTKTVVISNQNQVESVVLTYTQYLFRDGIYVGTWEGQPWKATDSSTANRYVAPTIAISDTLIISSSTSSGSTLGTALNTQTLDLSKSTLHITWTAKSSSGDYAARPMIIRPYANNYTRVVQGNTITTASGTQSLDISSLTSGDYYFAIMFFNTVSITVSEVRCE